MNSLGPQYYYGTPTNSHGLAKMYKKNFFFWTEFADQKNATGLMSIRRELRQHSDGELFPRSIWIHLDCRMCCQVAGWESLKREKVHRDRTAGSQWHITSGHTSLVRQRSTRPPVRDVARSVAINKSWIEIFLLRFIWFYRIILDYLTSFWFKSFQGSVIQATWRKFLTRKLHLTKRPRNLAFKAFICDSSLNWIWRFFFFKGNFKRSLRLKLFWSLKAYQIDSIK